MTGLVKWVFSIESMRWLSPIGLLAVISAALTLLGVPESITLLTGFPASLLFVMWVIAALRALWRRAAP